MHAGTNRSLVLEGVGRLSVQDRELSPLRPGMVRIAPRAVGVCGSDVHGFAGLNDRRAPGVVMGHEVAGVVVARGAGSSLAEGARVAVNPVVACGECAPCREGASHLCRSRLIHGCTPRLPGGFAEYLDVHEANAVVLPDDVPFEWGALIEPLAVGAHAVGRLGGDVPPAVAVVGGGPIGIACALAARRAGAEPLVVEPRPDRRALAQALGFAAAEPDAATASDRFGAVFECVGLAPTLQSAMLLARPGGTIVCVGIADTQIPVEMSALVIEERALAGSSAYGDGDFRATAASLAAGDVDLGLLVDRRVALDELPAAFAALRSGEIQGAKVLMVQ